MDCCFKTNEGRFNFRVGAIIIHEGKLLMVKNSRDSYYYSVGGRVKMNEPIEMAVIREVFEETGIKYEIERLAFIHENFFTLKTTNEHFHEISFFYFMKPNNMTDLIGESFTEDGIEEKLEWLPLNVLTNFDLFPDFFKTELFDPTPEFRHFVTIE